jgi:hypothetical protein
LDHNDNNNIEIANLQSMMMMTTAGAMTEMTPRFTTQDKEVEDVELSDEV